MAINPRSIVHYVDDAQQSNNVSCQPELTAEWMVSAKLMHGGCRDVVPVVVVMKAMGIESDQEVSQLIGSEGTYAGLFAPSLQECKQLGVFSQQQALEWLGVCTVQHVCSKPCLPVSL